MARFRLSTDILSPLNSDISLNDASTFSFGSLPDVPVFDSNIASPLCSTISKERDISLLGATNMKVSANALDVVTSGHKKQSSLNSETEEAFQGSYEELKKSMDDLFGKDLHSPIVPPHLKNGLNSKNLVSMQSRKSAIGKIQNTKNKNHLVEDQCLNAENTSENSKISETSKEESEKCTNKKSIANKLKKNQHQSKQISSLSEPLKGAKNKNEVCIKKTDASVSKNKNASMDKKTSSRIISKSDEASSDAKEPISKKVLEKKEDKKRMEGVRGYDFKCQKKIPVSSVNKPVIENKDLSIEKSIQLAVNMEMDNIRRFELNQNLLMRKDLLELQDITKKQNEVTEYLFSVIDDLLETNKQLISKYK